MSNRNLVSLIATATAAGLYSSAMASPYAAQITESAGTVTYTLSENADQVIIVRDGIASAPISGLTAGTQTFARNGAASYQIIATKNSGAGYTTIKNNNRADATAGGGFNGPVGTELLLGTPATNPALQLFAKDVAINTNPANPALFGRAYVLQGDATTAANNGGRLVTQGIFILNADRTQNALSVGDTGLTGGEAFNTATSSDFQRGDIDADGNLYIADFTDPTGTVRVADPNIASVKNVLVGLGSTGAPVLSSTLNHGSIAGMAVRGSPSAGTLSLVTLDEDIAPSNSTHIYALNSQNVGNSVTATQGVSALLTVPGITVDTEVDRDGRIYEAQYRANDAQETGLFVVSPDGQKVTYDSFKDTSLLGLDGATSVTGVQDVFRFVQGIDVSPDGKMIAAGTNSGGRVIIAPLYEGIPDLANAEIIQPGTGNVFDVEFDAANNLWTTSRSSGVGVREVSAGGGSYTVYDSTGKFKVINGSDFEGSGSYNDASKFITGGVSPNANEATAYVGALATGGSQTMTIDSQTVLAKLEFDGGNYTVNGSAPIIMGNDGVNESFLESRIIATAGDQTINAQVDIRHNLGVVAYTGATLTLTNTTYANAATSPGLLSVGGLTPNLGNLTIQKFGGGTVNMPAFDQKMLIVRAGILKFNNTTATAAKVKSLVFSGITGASQSTATPPVVTGTSGTAAGALDLGGNAIVVDYAPLTGTALSPLTDVNYLTASGRATGKGIFSSATASNSRLAVAAAEISSLPKILAAGTYRGVSVDDTSVVVSTLLKGDADFSGGVNFDDLIILAQNYNKTGKAWTTGDFTFDGTVNFDDLIPLAQNYNKTYNGTALVGPGASAAAFATDWAFAQSLVPEPTSLSLLGLGVVAMIRRRK